MNVDRLSVLPEKVRALVSQCPSAGSGVNDYQFVSAMALSHYWDEETIYTFLREKVAGCGRHVSEEETGRQVRRGIEFAGHRSSANAIPYKQKWKKATDHPENVKKALGASQIRALDLSILSPVAVPPEWTPENFLRFLFQGDPLICCGRYQQVGRRVRPICETRRLSEWGLDANSQSLVVPSPMSKPHGVTNDGRASCRCNDNTGPRKYFVVEFDTIDFDTQARCIWRLHEVAPLTMALWSGGKSIHAWFSVEGEDEFTIQSFAHTAASLGADHHALTPCQLMRMPHGIRENGRKQRVFYFDFEQVNSSISNNEH